MNPTPLQLLLSWTESQDPEARTFFALAVSFHMPTAWKTGLLRRDVDDIPSEALGNELLQAIRTQPSSSLLFEMDATVAFLRLIIEKVISSEKEKDLSLWEAAIEDGRSENLAQLGTKVLEEAPLKRKRWERIHESWSAARDQFDDTAVNRWRRQTIDSRQPSS